jgi:alpha-beta hydrolase superfamily lysophospholipase
LIPPGDSAKEPFLNPLSHAHQAMAESKEISPLNTELTIQFQADGFQLTGTLHLPAAPNPPVVIGCHGLLANRDSPKQISLARACNAQGMAYFRFDHRGCGDSQGDFHKVTSLQARCSDLYHAVETMQHNHLVGPPAAFFGSSFGGTVVLAYAARNNPPTLITYAAPLDSASIRHANIRDHQGSRPDASLLTKALEFDIAPQLAAIHDILITHSQNDETVPVDHARRIHSQVGEPKKLVIFEGGDHRMSDPDHQQQFEDLFIRWLKSRARS